MIKKILSLILILTFIMPYTSIASNEEVDSGIIYEMDLSNGIPEGVRADDGLELNVVEIDGKNALEIVAPVTGKYLYVEVPFKKDVTYCIEYTIKTKEGAGSIRTALTRQESFPNFELLTYTRSVNAEWAKVRHSYKCFMDYDFGTDDVTGDVSIPFNTVNTYYITDFTVYEKDYDNIAYEFPYKPFTDMDEHWAKPMVSKMAFEKVINGFSDGSFKPEGTVTRAEFVTMVINYTKDELKTYNNSLSDVSSGDWYANVLQTALDNGYIPESMTQNGEFKPNTPINREEMAAITACIYKQRAEDIYRADLSGYADLSSVSDWAKDDLSIAVRLGIVNGTDATHISPKSSATRAQAAVMLARLKQAVDNIALKSKFIEFCEKLIKTCEEDGQNTFANELRADLEYFKENTLVEHSGFREGLVTPVDSFYENPYVRMLFNTDEVFSKGLYSGKDYYPLHVSNKTIKQYITRYISPAGHANTTSNMMFLLGTPESPYSGNPEVLNNILTMIETLSNSTDDNGDVAGFYGSTDANYDMFFYDPYCILYYTFINTFPCFNLPSLSKRYSEFITTGMDYIKSTYPNGGYYNHYQNVDLIYLNSLMAAGMTLDRQDWIDEANEMIEISLERTFEDGGTPYLYNETECPSYHFAVLRDFFRIYTVCHSEKVAELLKKTEGYYKTAIEPSGVSTLGSSVLIWKRANATGTTDSMAPIITWKFSQDDYNKKMAQLQLLRIPSLDFTGGSIVAMAMCWTPELNDLNSVNELEFEDNFIIPNSNVNGFTGRFGNFSFVGDAMNRIVENPPSNVVKTFKNGSSGGKTSFVGATISNAESIASKTSIDSHFHMAYSAVRTGTKNTPDNFANTAHITNDSYIITDDFATLSTVYTLGTFNGSGYEIIRKDGWLGKQAWFTAKDRMIGYMALESQAENKMGDMLSKLMFAEGGHKLEKIDSTHYKYGKFRIHVIKTNYDRVTIDDNARRCTSASHYRTALASELIFGNNSSDKIYKGESKYVIFDIYPEWAEDAKSVVFSRLPEGVIKLDIKETAESDKISLLYNETDKEVNIKIDKATELYEVQNEEQVKAEAKSFTGEVSIAPFEHAVVK